ncbi:hypothetical protein QQ045_000761 [Rhodiola kirilowii]
MAEIPAEQTGESAAAGETSQRALLTPFLTKTYQLVDDPVVDDLISWNEDGSGFIIWKPAEFSRDLLPKYFKHNNLSSFVRQLNTYGFRKVVPDRFEFGNDFFKKGEKGLLHDIQRRKMTIGVSTSSATSAAEGPSVVQSMQSSVMPKSGGDDQQSTPGGSAQLQAITDSTTTTTPVVVEEENEQETKSSSPELVEENERLEMENQQMTNELSHLQGLCNNIFSMMSNYGPSSGQQDLGNMSVDSKQLDLLQSGGMVMDEQGGSSGGGEGGAMNDKQEVEEKTSPRLFGVSIGAKRQKINGEDRSSHRRKQRDDAETTENNNYSNTAQSERKQEPGPY